jgi:hypothetical protein
MVQKNDEKLFAYVRVRILQNYLEAWFNIAQQAATWMIPTLLCVLSLQRSLSFAYVTNTEFDFASTHAKIQEEGYILFNEREQLGVVLGEVGLKGILPA